MPFYKTTCLAWLQATCTGEVYLVLIFLTPERFRSNFVMVPLLFALKDQPLSAVLEFVAIGSLRILISSDVSAKSQRAKSHEAKITPCKSSLSSAVPIANFKAEIQWPPI